MGIFLPLLVPILFPLVDEITISFKANKGKKKFRKLLENIEKERYAEKKDL